MLVTVCPRSSATDTNPVPQRQAGASRRPGRAGIAVAVLALLALLIAPVLMAAEPEAARAPAPRQLFESYGRDDGLGNPNVFGLMQDRAGFLWVGTQRGLYRYEGTRFRHYRDAAGLSEPGGDGNLMGALLQDRSGNIWVGMQSGLFVVDGEQLSPVTRGGQAIGLNSMTSALADLGDGRLLAVSIGALLQVAPDADGSGWQARPYAVTDPEHRIDPQWRFQSVHVDPAGELWLGCGLHLCQVGAGGVRVWNEADGLPSGEWYRLLTDRAGTLWALSLDRLVARPRGATRFEDRTPALPLLAGSNIFALSEDAQGRMRTSVAGGIAVWEHGGWTVLGTDRGLPEPPVIALLDTADGDSWYGVAGAGLLRRLGDDRWQHLLPADGLQNGVIWAIAEDTDGRRWIATHSGVDIYDPRSGRVQPWARGRELGIGSIQWIRRDTRGRLWMAGNAGVVVMHDPRSGETRRGQTSGSFNDLLIDADDRVWLAGFSGLHRAVETAGAGEPGLRVELVQPVADGGVRQLITRPGRDIVASTARGLYWLRDGALKPVPLAAPGLSYGDMSADGSLWFVDSARGGLLHFDAGLAAPPQFLAFAPLARDTPSFLRRDARDRLWIGTDNGVVVYDHGRWQRLGRSNGLIWDDCDSGAFFAGDDDSVVIGTSNGLTRISEVGAVLAAVVAPRAGIVEARWNGVPLAPDGAVPVPAAAGRSGTLALEFSAWPFGAARDYAFRYRLAGVDADWVESAHADARYPGLGAGRYRFELQAVDPQRGLDSEIVALDFEVPARWWQRAPGIAALALLAAAALLALLRYVDTLRSRQLLRRQHLLERLVDERTRELEHDKQQLIEAREDLRILAARDGLTGLLNRSAIFECLQADLDASRRDGKAMAAVLVDIDHFKVINDTYGHPVGDEVLRETAARLAGAVRASDGVGRYGGEEFLLVLRELRPGSDERLQRLLDAVRSRPVAVAGQLLQITCSAGVAVAQPGQEDIDALIARADRALYAAKHAGRDRLQVAPPASAAGAAATR